jgi:hypothetical protein
MLAFLVITQMAGMTNTLSAKDKVKNESFRLFRNAIILLVVFALYWRGLYLQFIPSWIGWILVVLNSWGILSGAFSTLMMFLAIIEHPFLNKEEKEDTTLFSMRWKIVGFFIHLIWVLFYGGLAIWTYLIMIQYS